MSVKVKICGLAREKDYVEALATRPDAVGFIFWPKSPRAVQAAQVADWTRSKHPAEVLKVGVFVNQPLGDVIRIVETAQLDVVQLHGEESWEYVESLPVPVWKVVHLDRVPLHLSEYPAAALLVDSGSVEVPGGTGVRVNEEAAAAFVRENVLPVWLAGGLNARNVQSAIAHVAPFGVDVSSGVEKAPGQKDHQALRNFVHAARTPLAPVT
jgi:phosphoribosylanthranilate isomerase